MRATIQYSLQIDFAEPARALTQVLRLTPRDFDSQHLLDWSVGVDPDVRMRRSVDTFGNIVHACSHDGPLERLSFFAGGEIETGDAAGVVRGSSEKFPLDVYLRDLESTRADVRLHEFTRDTLGAEAEPLGRMHLLLDALAKVLAFEPGETPAPRPAAEVFKDGKGSARELAQVFIAAARGEHVPARFISGFFIGAEGARDAGAHHGWAEVFVPPIGWIGFDCALGICPRDEHLRIAQGLDYYGAAPRRGASFGYVKEQASARLTIDFARHAAWQVQQ
ncbi:transglutaminase family protein [uncultured Rhodoblastus sp.]|uniref:transglutaminase family protein n=1 Tax=uncultured Rhodoblastus sp. TaxID=543037 RepID=UPI0025F2A3C0|nr:transglutaminase family protein [uncultured Rhodoblastus sp.]